VNPQGAVETIRPVSRWQRKLALEGVELASFARRAWALAIDFVALVALLALCVVPVAWWANYSHRNIHIEFNPFHNWYSTILPVIYFGLLVWLTNGRTLGKWLTGIRVVSLAHERISFWHSLERALGYGASLLEAGSGFFQYLVNANRQTVHDRIAETIVVRLRK
jgi:uncharacterized RDD family membrane protein YckC